MHNKYFIFLFPFLFLYNCSIDTTSLSESIYEISDLEYRILKTTIDSAYDYLSTKKIVINDSTTTGLNYIENADSLTNIFLYGLKDQMPYLANETIEDFKLKNHSKTAITRPQDIHINAVLSSENDEFLPYIEVSRVGFNRNKTQALVYIGNLDAPRAGHGAYYMLLKKRKKWIIVYNRMFWIA